MIVPNFVDEGRIYGNGKDCYTKFFEFTVFFSNC